jgi:hypothetical protein
MTRSDQIKQILIDEHTTYREEQIGWQSEDADEKINRLANDDKKLNEEKFYKAIYKPSVRTNMPLIKSIADRIFYGGQPLSVWYNEYLNKWERLHPPKDKKDARVYTPGTINKLKYPFKTKFKKFKEEHHLDKNILPHEPVPDYKIKPLTKKLTRPTYSIEPHSYEIDLFYVNHPFKDNLRLKNYLVVVNVNTRFVFVIPMKNKSGKEFMRAISGLLREVQINSLKGDGEGGFASKKDGLPEFYKRNKIKTYFQSSKFTYHNKIVDGVIRTLRDAMGLDSFKLADEDLMSQLVSYYNDSYHKSIKMTPREMQENEELEWEYIRKMDRKLNERLHKQAIEGLHNYKPGNVLLIHLDKSKTSMKFDKHRRNFEELAVFVRYEHGNVICTLIKPYPNTNTIEIPIYFTKYVSKDINSIPMNYKSFFGLN